MKPTQFLVTLLILILGSSACCHKKHCEDPVKALVFMPKNFAYDEYLTVQSWNKKTSQIEQREITHGFPIVIYDSNLQPLKDYDYFIETNYGINDTIKNMSYDLTRTKKVCNSCVFGNDYYEQLRYSNFSYEYKGSVHSDKDTIYVLKR